MKLVVKLALSVVFLLGMSSLTQTLRAQSTTGSIYGVVADITGAAVPGATVTITNVHTNVSQATTTNGAGEYTFAIVNPGDYSVASSSPGFQEADPNRCNGRREPECACAFRASCGAGK